MWTRIDTHRHAQTHRRTQIHVHTDAYMQIDANRRTQTHTDAIHTHSHPHTPTYTHTTTHIHTRTHARIYIYETVGEGVFDLMVIIKKTFPENHVDIISVSFKNLPTKPHFSITMRLRKILYLIEKFLI